MRKTGTINGGNNVAKKSIAKKNRFAGCGAVYSTKKYYVGEYLSQNADGKARYYKRYIKKTPRSHKEFTDMFGSYKAR